MQLVEQTTTRGHERLTLRPHMPPEEIVAELDLPSAKGLPGLRVGRNRFFLVIASFDMPTASVTEWIVPYLRTTVHVPGLRAKSSRTYPRAVMDSGFPGTFDYYFASVIDQWQSAGSDQIYRLNEDLSHLGLAPNIVAQRLSESEIDLRVRRIPERDSNDTVSIADVGFGVSQTLPVLVALRAAYEGQLVYIEEPEIHLHPRAQVRLADILVGAAKRGVRVVAETHSSLILRALQTIVAKGEVAPEVVRFHWFTRDDRGVTTVRSATPDENGAFGDWPEDFGDVDLQSEKDYLDAVESKIHR